MKNNYLLESYRTLNNGRAISVAKVSYNSSYKFLVYEDGKFMGELVENGHFIKKDGRLDIVEDEIYNLYNDIIYVRCKE